MPLLSILITSRNAPRLLKKALEAVLERTKLSNEIIVCDDSDDTEAVYAEIPKRIRKHILWLPSEGLKNFSLNANRALPLINGAIVTCPPLAEDVEVQEGWDETIMDFLLRNADVGQAGFNVNGKWGQNPEDGSYIGKGVTTRAIMEQVGDFDPQFSFWGADNDYSYRIKQLGLKLAVCSESNIFHHHDWRNMHEVDNDFKNKLKAKWPNEAIHIGN